MMRTIILLCWCWLAAAPVWSQTYDQVKLLNGQEYQGQLQSYDPAEGAWIKTTSGDLVFVAAADIRRVFQGDPNLPTNYIQPAAIDTVYVVRLRNGATFRGQLVSYLPQEKVVLQVDRNVQMVFLDAEIVQVDYELKSRRRTPRTELPMPVRDRAYAFREQGRYQHTTFAVSMGSLEVSNGIVFDPFGNPIFPATQSSTQLGFSLQHVVGYQFHRWAGVGGGISFDNYRPERGELVMAAFAEYRAYLTGKRLAPYALLGAGYGQPFRNQRQGITAAKGGWMLNPALGLRLGASSSYNFTFDLGYRFQRASFTQEFPFVGDEEIRRILYKRLLIRMGVVF